MLSNRTLIAGSYVDPLLVVIPVVLVVVVAAAVFFLVKL